MKTQLVKGFSSKWPWIGLCLLTVACSKNGASTSTGGSNSTQGVAIDYARYSQTTTVCSPLNGANPTLNPSTFITYTNGLQGRLFSRNPGTPTPLVLSDFFQDSTDVGVNLFLNDLNVPTRLFSEGFPNAAGQLLADANGNTLVEYFGMQLQSAMQLTLGDTAGAYQFALIADDGATLSIKTLGNNNDVKLIDDDGTHPSLMKCATSPLTINSYDQIPIQVQYFQGPRYEIALMLMWRPWPTDASKVQDPLCDTEGNTQFFDPSTSTPNANYQALLSRGWKPLKTGNYVIPEVSFNPCNVPNYFGAN